MKKLFPFLAFILFLSNTSNAQLENFLNNTELTFSYAFQEHDDRLFDYPAWIHDIEQPGKGTSDFTVGLIKKINFLKYFEAKMGLLYGMEQNTFRRAYSQYYLSGDLHLDLRVIKKYRVSLMKVPLNFQFTILPKWKNKFYIGVGLLPGFDFRKAARCTCGKFDSKWKLGFYALEFNPEIGFETPKYGIAFYYRMHQIKKIDKVSIHEGYFNYRQDILDFFERKHERYNPYKVGVRFSYKLNFQK